MPARSAGGARAGTHLPRPGDDIDMRTHIWIATLAMAATPAFVQAQTSVQAQGSASAHAEAGRDAQGSRHVNGSAALDATARAGLPEAPVRRAIAESEANGATA